MVLRKDQLNSRTQKRARFNKIKIKDRTSRTPVRRRINKTQMKSRVNKRTLNAKSRDKVVKSRKLTKTSVMPLNIDFYQIADSVYNSYWVGKLINTLQKEGRKPQLGMFTKLLWL